MPKLALLLSASLFAAPAVALADGADTGGYRIQIEVAPSKKAQKSVAKIHIAPAAGYHVNKEYPTTMTLSDVPAGILVDRLKQTAKDAVKLEEAGAEFDVAFTPADAGKKTINGELRFAVCSANSCDPKSAKLSIPVEVK
jgi:hypothetical protein